jgi:hypothetical protein
MPSVADSAAVASICRLWFSRTEIDIVFRLRLFERGEKWHLVWNLLPKGMFDSGIEMQYWMSCSDCRTMVWFV